MDIIHFFLWVSHGNTVSPLATSSEIYHSKIPRFVYYSEHGRAQVDDSLIPYNLLAMQKPPNNSPLSNFPSDFSDFYIGYDVRENVGGYIRIPTLVYSLDPDPLSIVATYSGIYYFKLRKYFVPGDQTAKYGLVSYDRIFVHNDLLQIYRDKYITHSNIEKHVLDYCKKNKISDLNKVNIGFFSCKLILDIYINEYSELPLDIHEETVEPANIINFEQHHAQIVSSLLTINIDNAPFSKKNWQALAGLTHQGCAMNVLSYYDLMSLPKARQRAVCLTLKGTSIFRIIDYLNYYLKFSISTPINYLVCRYNIEYGLTIINSFMNAYKSDDNYVIIFKIYKDLVNPTKPEEYSEIGHTLSVAFNRNDGYNWIIDPQIQFSEALNNGSNDDLYKKIITNYGDDFKFVDIIFAAQSGDNIRFSMEPTRIVVPSEAIIADISTGHVFLRNRPVNVPYGGILSKRFKRSKKTRRTKKTKRTKRTKIYKKTKKNKTHKPTKKYKY
jgi:hypothetical protein